MKEFTIHGLPVPKGRPRVFLRGKVPTAITPQTTLDYERKVNRAARNAALPLISGPVGVEIDFYFPVPSATRKRDIDSLVGAYAMNRADVDNLAKSILDGLNGVAFADDCQVAFLFAQKIWCLKGDERAVIRVAALKPKGTLL